MTITDTPRDNVVHLHAAGAGPRAMMGAAPDAGMQALAVRSLEALHLLDEAQGEVLLIARTLRGIVFSKNHCGERLWLHDMLEEKIINMKDRASRVHRPPFWFGGALWFGDLMKSIDATVTLLAETLWRDDSHKGLRGNLAAYLEKQLKEVDGLTGRAIEDWEKRLAGEQQPTAH
jgi:hypothetical protein